VSDYYTLTCPFSFKAITSRRGCVKLLALASKLFQVIDSQMYSSAGFSDSITFKLFSSEQNMNFQLCVTTSTLNGEKYSLQQILMNGTWAITKRATAFLLRVCFKHLYFRLSPPFIVNLISGILWPFYLFGFACRHAMWFKIIYENVREFRTTENVLEKCGCFI